MLKDQLLAEGKEAPNLFDSNAISPGTKFMFELNKQLEFFVQYKLNTDTLYQRVSITLSLYHRVFCSLRLFYQIQVCRERASTK